MDRRLHLGVVYAEDMHTRTTGEMEIPSRTTGKVHLVKIVGDSFIHWGETTPDYTNHIIVDFRTRDVTDLYEDHTWLLVLEAAAEVRKYLHERAEITGLFDDRVADYAIVTDTEDRYPQMYSTFLPTR